MLSEKASNENERRRRRRGMKISVMGEGGKIPVQFS